MNTVIIVSLFAIVLALMVGYITGFRHGKKDGEQESELRHNRIAGRQLHKALFGGQVAGRN